MLHYNKLATWYYVAKIIYSERLSKNSKLTFPLNNNNNKNTKKTFV